MDKTQNLFEKFRKMLKQYRFNRETQKVERDEFSGKKHVNRRTYLKRKKKNSFRMRGAAVVAGAFLVLAGAGAVDAQTKGMDMLNNGLGFADSPTISETAINSNDSGKIGTPLDNNGIQSARTAISQTTVAVAQTIADTGSTLDETVQVAEAVTNDSLPADQAVEAETEKTPLTTASVDVTPVETSSETIKVAEVTADQTMMSEPATEQTVADAAPAVETPVAVTPAEEAPVVASPADETPAVEETVAEETPAVAAPVVESPVDETPAVETPQAQFVLPASGRVGEIFRNYDSGYYSNHSNGAAVDILNSAGTPVYAAASGTVTLAGWYGGYGNCIVIDHGNDFSTLYGHFNTINVSEGQTVSQGDVIGGMGSTGSSTANHVHFEILLNGVAQTIGGFFGISTGDYV